MSHFSGHNTSSFHQTHGLLLCFSPWQKNEKVETDIELMLQDFDDEIEEIQVQTQTKEKIVKYSGYLLRLQSASDDGVWSAHPLMENIC